MWSRVAAAALLGLASTATAQTSSNCYGDRCYALNIPDSTASSGNGDIFIQITAPTSYSWVAIGQGSSMSGSHMFVMYTSADGNNVTVSPRLGTGQRMPQFTSDTQITLLEGSGVSNGQMTANFRCGNCQSWSGGSMDFTSSSATWIHASRSGSALNTDDTSASIQQHGGDYGSWDWDFTAAKGGSSVNPFASGTATTTGGTSSSTQDCVPRPSGTASGSGSSSGTSTTSAKGPPWRTGGSWPSGTPWNNYNDKRSESSDDGVNYCAPGQSSSSSSSSSAGAQIGGGAALAAARRERRMQTAHAVLACLAMVIFFPAGAISIRMFSFPGLLWFHGGLQVFAYAMFTAAVGIGIYIGQGEYIQTYHGVIGLVVFSLLFFMPIFGWLHHQLFKRYGHRTFWSYIHIWLGRLLITLGIINGGLGLKLAGSPQDWIIAYSVVAGVVWFVYIAAAVLGEARRKKTLAGAPADVGRERKGSSHSSSSPSGSSQREFYGRKNRGEA
ncbi:DOMON domain protein [Macrophomina phaseolina MS6]|uniref:DOMON domain protein n=1 Tax=Macrophomina phaseolina (strain MS6) TaxID=1126212 RepID=K2S450_MACPH|nr:DOMON domain protein [Macrophomina phaseolina MS6]